ncbi:MAG: response regulator [Candidatus Moranbacteria bacterium]|nr:response regulator [Candidatus Moranbacteria bacterium]
MTEIVQGQDAPKVSLLVVEDDKFYANIYRVKFTKEGYDIRLAGDGDEALKMARERKPDLILLDLIMPKKDGFETLRELKADTNLKDIRVIVFSNLSQDEDIKRVKDAGAFDYIVKANISLQDMVARVKGYVAQ